MLTREDSLFPAEAAARGVARALYASVKSLPIVSPHGHTQAAWFARNEPFPDPAKLFVQPDHYVYRMLYSQGVSLEELEIGQPELRDPRNVWRIFASHYYLFRGTPTRIWLDFAFHELFGLDVRLSASTADLYFDTISEKLQTPEFLPRALFERFNLEVLATTDSPIDTLAHHQAIRESNWNARILPTFRPDPVVDPEFAGFAANIAELGKSDRRRYRGVARLFERTSQDSRSLSRPWLHSDGSRSSHGANRRPLHNRSGSAVCQRPFRQRRQSRAGTVSRPDAHRDGSHEP